MRQRVTASSSSAPNGAESFLNKPIIVALAAGALTIAAGYFSLASQNSASQRDEQRILAAKAYLGYLDAFDTYYAEAGVFKTCVGAAVDKDSTACKAITQSLTDRTVALEAARREILIYGSDDAIALVVQTDMVSSQSSSPEIQRLQTRLAVLSRSISAEMAGVAAPPGCGAVCLALKSEKAMVEGQLYDEQIKAAAARRTTTSPVTELRGKWLGLVCREASPEPRSSCEEGT